ncbi:UbiH/UbiF family hydroxylase [Polycladidibacter stylochi]|uniref:UbiH/UbiF family hydroxylase n=1 Tax=Polycladidibacter stylochi TaxID=1807766 RepID=UPI00082A49ED|nr:UbiH/UbiF family hydroxylase [Pseudovibrio stylochi]
MQKITQSMPPKNYSIAIVGAGPAGIIAALALSKQIENGKLPPSFNIALVGPQPSLTDCRSTALMQASKQFLENIDLWQPLASKVTPLQNMRIIDATERLIRAPETIFRAEEINQDAFGYNILNKDLNLALVAQLKKSPHITWHNTTFETCDEYEEGRLVRLSDTLTFTSQLIVAADGRNSKCRELANINIKKWQYPQTALVLNLKHERAHNNTSIEFHRATGPFTLVPMPGNESSLVCVLSPSKAEELNALTDDELALALEKLAYSTLGKFTVSSKRQLYPMSGFSVNKLAHQRTVLIGESAHAFPPIGAQGLNLTMRDIAQLSSQITSAFETDPETPEIGNETFLQTYDQKRKLDVSTRTTAVDLLNRSLLSNAIPIQMVRSIGLYTLASLPPLRRLIMNEGIAPMWRTPKNMRKASNERNG